MEDVQDVLPDSPVSKKKVSLEIQLQEYQQVSRVEAIKAAHFIPLMSYIKQDNRWSWMNDGWLFCLRDAGTWNHAASLQQVVCIGEQLGSVKKTASV